MTKIAKLNFANMTFSNHKLQLSIRYLLSLFCGEERVNWIRFNDSIISNVFFKFNPSPNIIKPWNLVRRFVHEATEREFLIKRKSINFGRFDDTDDPELPDESDGRDLKQIEESAIICRILGTVDVW